MYQESLVNANVSARQPC